MNIHPDLKSILQEFKLPEKLGFGDVMAPVMFRVDYADGEWGTGQLLPYGPLALDPAAKVFHYAQILFEGLKAYRVETEQPVLFRPEKNWQRLDTSAERMLMPALPQELFMQGLFSVTAYCGNLIPRKPEHSLYLRPFMLGTQPALGLATSDTFSFYIIASPSEAVASGALKVLIERENTRAAKGGTGQVKVSGNYGAALYSTSQALKQGFHQSLWLDAVEHRYIEELSIMNFFAVIDNEIYTPELGGTILPGVTRDSVIRLAEDEGFVVHKQLLDIDELLNSITTGACTELFACGTAVIIAPISTLGDAGDRVYDLPAVEKSVALQLRQKLLDIQEGRTDDRFSWLCPIPEQYHP